MNVFKSTEDFQIIEWPSTAMRPMMGSWFWQQGAGTAPPVVLEPVGERTFAFGGTPGTVTVCREAGLLPRFSLSLDSRTEEGL